MTTLLEVEKAVAQLPKEDLVKFAHWFGKYESGSINAAKQSGKTLGDFLLSAPIIDDDLDISRSDEPARDVEL